MKNLKTLLVVVLLNVSLLTVALPPDIQVDRYFLQVEKELKDNDNKKVYDKSYNKAAEIMDKIMTLKDEHNLELFIAAL